MANDPSRVAILQEQLTAAGIPVDGITVQDVNAVPPDVTIHYSALATQEQITLGQQILAAFDWRERRPASRATVVGALTALMQSQRDTVYLHAMAEWLRQDSQLAASISATTGVPLPVDEVVP